MRVDVVDEAEEVVGEEECIGDDAEDAAGAAVDGGATVSVGEESGDEVAWSAVGWGEADDAISGANAGVAGAMEGDHE